MIDWSEVAPMIVFVVFILTTGGVLLLRPGQSAPRTVDITTVPGPH